jgi:hypothetical protein
MFQVKKSPADSAGLLTVRAETPNAVDAKIAIETPIKPTFMAIFPSPMMFAMQ